MKIQELFFELSHEGRYQIFKEISLNGKKHTQLEAKLGLPGPEVSRHLKRLVKMKLVQKESNGIYKLTSFGQILFLIVPFFENITNYVDFVNSHDFAPIPLDLFFQIAMIPGIELRTKTMENVELLNDLIKNADHYIYSITNQLQTSMIPIVQKKLQSGKAIDLKAVLERELFKKFTKVQDPPVFDPNLLGKIGLFENVRLLDKLSLSMTITEGGALIFLRAGNSIDYEQSIFGKSPAFLEAAKRIFAIFWDRGILIQPADLAPG